VTLSTDANAAGAVTAPADRSTFAIHPTGVAAPEPPYSHVVIAGDVVAVSGQMPVDPSGDFVDGDFAAQAAQVFRNFGACLEAAACSPSDVFKVTAYLSDLANVPAFNELYRTFFAAPFPARTTVRADLIGPNTLIELDGLALRSPRNPETDEVTR
jgi:2-iminobutanoate/2-iminopropanoate deaminase